MDDDEREEFEHALGGPITDDEARMLTAIARMPFEDYEVLDVVRAYRMGRDQPR